MRTYHLSLVLASIALFPGTSRAGEATAQDANRALAKAFETAWNTHDMENGLRKLLTYDIDWISVSGDYEPGTDGIENVVRSHVRVHSTVKFKDSILTVRDAHVALIKPDVGLVHVRWHIAGDRDNDGTARPPRDGVFTWVTVLQNGEWKIRASQNTNTTPIK